MANDAPDFTGSVSATFPSAQKVEFDTPQQVTFPSAQQVEFGTPQQVEFSSPQQVTFPSAQQVEFGTPQQVEFDTPQQVTFPNAQQVEFGTPQQVTFPSAQQVEFGTPQKVEFDTPQQVTFPNAQQVEFGTPQQVEFSSPQQVTFPSAQQVEFAAPQQVEFATAQQVTFPSAQDVNLAATGPVNVTNDILTQGPMWWGPKQDFAFNVAADGGQYVFYSLPRSAYSRIWIVLYSPSGNLGNILIQSASQLRDSDIFSSGLATYYGINSIPVASGVYGDDLSKVNLYGPLVIPDDTSVDYIPAINMFVAYIASTVAINETMSMAVYAQYASVTVDNKTDAPAQIQPASGEYDTVQMFSVSSPGTNVTLLSSGNYLKRLHIDAMYDVSPASSASAYSASVALFNGGTIFSRWNSQTNNSTTNWLDGTYTWEYDFGGGVYNNGITVNASYITQITGYAVLSSQTPHQKVSVVT